MTDSSAKLPNLWLLIAAAASILLITMHENDFRAFCPARRQLDRIEHDPVQPDYCRVPIDVGHIATLVRRVGRPFRRV